MKNRSVVEELLHLPWWVSLVLALIFYVAGTLILPTLSFDNPIFKAFGSAAKGVSVPASMVLCCIALFSFIKSKLSLRQRNKLFEKQKGIETIKELSWEQFERLIGELFSRKGYSVTENTLKGADDGVDLRLVKDGKKYIVQCKHWKGKVGVGVVREHLGAITAMGVEGGFVVTSGEFTSTAATFANKNSIGLVDGSDLSSFIKAGSGMSNDTELSAELDNYPDVSGCPNCGSTMVRRTARKGRNAGNDFYGCSTYPQCKGIRPI